MGAFCVLSFKTATVVCAEMLRKRYPPGKCGCAGNSLPRSANNETKIHSDTIGRKEGGLLTIDTLLDVIPVLTEGGTSHCVKDSLVKRLEFPDVRI